MHRHTFHFTVVAGLLAVAAGLAGCKPAAPGGVARSGTAESCEAALWPNPEVHLSLTSQTGARITEDNFRGRKTLVFFGFTHCPDACPTAMAKLGAMAAMLPKGEPEPHVLFVSVDPKRDTPEALSLYAASNGFPKDLTAATGTDAELQALAKDLKAAYSVEEDPSSASGYLVNHTALIYLMDANWKLRTYFLSEMSPAAMAQCVAAIN